MAFTKTWQESVPAGSRSPALGDDDIRDLKYAIRERMAVDHNWFQDESGESNVACHKKVTLLVQTTITALANAGIIYTKDANSKAELHFKDEDGNEIQLTSGGVLYGGCLVSSTAQGDLLYYSAANTIARLAKDANATRYLSNTGTTNNPAWAQVNLTNGVTGALPVANGGTARTAALAASQVTGNTDVDVGSSEADADDMSTTFTTYGTKILTIFSAPFYNGSASDKTLTLKIYVDGTEKRSTTVEIASEQNLEFVGFQWLETSLTAGSHTVKVRWLSDGGDVDQRGSTDGVRVLTCLDLD